MRHAALVAAILAGVGLALACGPDREGDLRREIAALNKERVSLDAIGKAKQEADAAEADAAARAQELDQAKALLAKLQAEARASAAAFEGEVKRNEALRTEIDTAGQSTLDARKQDMEIEARIEQAQERAGYLRDRAETLAQQLRPDDPAWANARRVGNVSQLLAEAAHSYPDDPVLAALARTDLRSSDEAPAPVGAAATAAESLGDRLRWVYGLETAPVATKPPEPSSGGKAPVATETSAASSGGKAATSPETAQ